MFFQNWCSSQFEFLPTLPIPHSIILRKNHAPISFSCVDIDDWGFLIKLHIYMMSKIIYCAWLSTINHRHQPWSPRHKTAINGRALALSSLQWFHTIFTSYIFNANGVKTGVLHSPPPSTTLSSVLYKIEQNATLAPPSVLCRIEQKWMCQSHGILQH